jgi:hypothetical protein
VNADWVGAHLRFCQVSSLSCVFTSSLKWSKAVGPVPTHSVSIRMCVAGRDHHTASILRLHIWQPIDLAICLLYSTIECGTTNELATWSIMVFARIFHPRFIILW